MHQEVVLHHRRPGREDDREVHGQAANVIPCTGVVMRRTQTLLWRRNFAVVSHSVYRASRTGVMTLAVLSSVRRAIFTVVGWRGEF